MATEKQILDLPQVDQVFAGSYFIIDIGGVAHRISGADLISSLNGGNPFKVMVSEESGLARQLTVGDKNRYIYFSSLGTAVASLSLAAAAGFSIGDTITLRNEGGGSVEVVGTGGVVIMPSSSGLSLTEAGQTGQLLCVAPNTFHFLTGGSGASYLEPPLIPLDYAATITPDLEEGTFRGVVLEGVMTVAAPINASDGDTFKLSITADLVDRLITFNSVYKTGTYSKTVLAGKTNIYTFVRVDSTNWQLRNFIEGV